MQGPQAGWLSVSYLRKAPPRLRRVVFPGVSYHDYADTWAPHGSYAGHYGRAVTFLIGMHKATGTESWFNAAQDLADEAIETLYKNGLFLGHPCKDYYDAVDGVGYLLNAYSTLIKYLITAHPLTRPCRRVLPTGIRDRLYDWRLPGHPRQAQGPLPWP